MNSEAARPNAKRKMRAIARRRSLHDAIAQETDGLSQRLQQLPGWDQKHLVSCLIQLQHAIRGDPTVIQLRLAVAAVHELKASLVQQGHLEQSKQVQKLLVMAGVAVDITVKADNEAPHGTAFTAVQAVAEAGRELHEVAAAVAVLDGQLETEGEQAHTVRAVLLEARDLLQLRIEAQQEALHVIIAADTEASVDMAQILQNELTEHGAMQLVADVGQMLAGLNQMLVDGVTCELLDNAVLDAEAVVAKLHLHGTQQQKVVMTQVAAKLKESQQVTTRAKMLSSSHLQQPIGASNAASAKHAQALLSAIKSANTTQGSQVVPTSSSYVLIVY